MEGESIKHCTDSNVGRRGREKDGGCFLYAGVTGTNGQGMQIFWLGIIATSIILLEVSKAEDRSR